MMLDVVYVCYVRYKKAVKSCNGSQILHYVGDII